MVGNTPHRALRQSWVGDVLSSRRFVRLRPAQAGRLAVWRAAHRSAHSNRHVRRHRRFVLSRGVSHQRRLIAREDHGLQRQGCRNGVSQRHPLVPYVLALRRRER